jgi:hypothetical protein
MRSTQFGDTINFLDLAEHTGALVFLPHSRLRFVGCVDPLRSRASASLEHFLVRVAEDPLTFLFFPTFKQSKLPFAVKFTLTLSFVCACAVVAECLNANYGFSRAKMSDDNHQNPPNNHEAALNDASSLVLDVAERLMGLVNSVSGGLDLGLMAIAETRSTMETLRAQAAVTPGASVNPARRAGILAIPPTARHEKSKGENAFLVSSIFAGVLGASNPSSGSHPHPCPSGNGRPRK